MTYWEMEPFITYDIVVAIHGLNAQNDMVFILEMVNLVKESGLKPGKIIFVNWPYNDESYENRIEFENSNVKDTKSGEGN
jgi:hypothetical protein